MVLAAMRSIPWIALALALLSATFYFSSTVSSLPPLVASHFDAAGHPNAYMSREFYTKFIFAMGVGFPLAMVALLAAIYSKASDMKLPNRDYWLAPERIAQTRSMLVAHGVWFGCLMVAMVCYVHWLELGAHRSKPPQLSNAMFMGGLFAFLGVAVGWILALVRAFRRPRIIT
jgi:phosphoglycerol transferase MdoB-like AlkP superfamily enzyme